MTLTLADIGVILGILAALNVPFVVYLRASMGSMYMPRSELALEMKIIQNALEALQASINRVQSPPEMDKLAALIPRLEAQEQRCMALSDRLAKQAED